MPDPSATAPSPGNNPPVAPPLPVHPPKASPDSERNPVNADAVLVSRARIRWYYLILVVTAISFFCMGWLANRPRSIKEKSAVPSVEGNDRVLVSGKLRFGRPNGIPIPDVGAVVIAVPSNAMPERRFPIEGLRPWDPDSATGQVNRNRLTEFGAGWTRTAEDGSYHLVLPRPGQYWVLMISKGLARSKATLELTNRGIPELDFEQLSRYFERPADLIGPQAYRWSLETVAATGLNLNHDFQTDRELGIPEIP
ncbi:MAG: hypothetical protein ACUVQG_07450 [Thermogutta sp.]